MTTQKAKVEFKFTPAQLIARNKILSKYSAELGVSSRGNYGEYNDLLIANDKNNIRAFDKYGENPGQGANNYTTGGSKNITEFVYFTRNGNFLANAVPGKGVTTSYLRRPTGGNPALMTDVLREKDTRLYLNKFKTATRILVVPDGKEQYWEGRVDENIHIVPESSIT